MQTEYIDMSEARCLGCGYQLRGLDHNRCPECGREFDPNDPATMSVPGWRPQRESTFSADIIRLAVAGAIFTVISQISMGLILHWLWAGLDDVGWRNVGLP